MSAPKHLVILASADPEDLIAPLNDSLAAWCRAGLLGEIVWVSTHELVTKRHKAQCWHSVGQEWLQSTLGVAMSRHFFSDVWLGVLRHPQHPNAALNKFEIRHSEEQAHEALRQLVGTQSVFRSLTVQIASADSTCDPTDCSAAWDYHLIHDTTVEKHQQLPKVRASDNAPLSLSASVALCFANGWRNTTSTVRLEGDRADGPFQPVRFVHCQIRILHMPAVANFALPSVTSVSPPWPLPQTTQVERAQPDAVPPMALATHLARESGITCRWPPPVDAPDSKFSVARIWSSLVEPVPPTDPRSRYERALERLAKRTGGVRSSTEATKRLELDDTEDLPSLVQHIKRSDFPPLEIESSDLVASADAWKTVRKVLFGLVDGAELPNEVKHPTHHTENSRLIWTDPRGIAPDQAPIDTSDIWPEESEDGATMAHHDTLMERLADAIRDSMDNAQRNFRNNCTLLAEDGEYQQAKKAQFWARITALCTLPILAILSRLIFVIPVSPWWFGFALLPGAIVVGVGIERMMEARGLLETHNFQRRRHGTYSTHYASEVLRLWGIAQQFADHRLVITEFLHRPFGQTSNNDIVTLSPSELAFNTEPPPSMLVAFAQADLKKIADIYKEQQEASVEPSWLNDAYNSAYSIWKDSFRDRVVGDYPDPDHDTAERYAVIHKSRHDGSDVYGARTDFALSVVGEIGTNESDRLWVVDAAGESVLGEIGTNESGWALKKAADERIESLLEKSDATLQDLLKVLSRIEPVHDAYPGIAAIDFFQFSARKRGFAWGQLLSPRANPPEVQVIQSDIGIVAAVSDDRSLMLAWRMELSEPVRPQDQANWTTDDHGGQSVDVHGSIV